jgi:hypothetical protein
MLSRFLPETAFLFIEGHPNFRKSTPTPDLTKQQK